MYVQYSIYIERERDRDGCFFSPCVMDVDQTLHIYLISNHLIS